MKKIFALMLALCLMLGCTALAEEPTELNWADVEAAAEEVGGQFIPIDLGLAVWAPNDYYVLSELNEEYTSKGIYAMIAPEDFSGAIALQYVEANGATALECVSNIEGAVDPKEMIINGFPCVNFDLPSMDATCVAFETEQGNLFVVSFLPLSNTDFAAKATIMVASLQSAE